MEAQLNRITGPLTLSREKLRCVEPSDGQLLMQGTELGYGWSIALDVNREDVFVLFGACTPSTQGGGQRSTS
jgi:hypothetical protein